MLHHKGIGGNIREVGIGFGTARHSAGRRGELPVIVYEVRKPGRSPAKEEAEMYDQACGPASEHAMFDNGQHPMSEVERAVLLSRGASARTFVE